MHVIRECFGGFEIAVNSAYLSNVRKITDTYKLEVDYIPVREPNTTESEKDFLQTGGRQISQNIRFCYRRAAQHLKLQLELEYQMLEFELNTYCQVHEYKIGRKIAQRLVLIVVHLVSDEARQKKSFKLFSLASKN